MNFKEALVLMALLINYSLSAQQETYIIRKTFFSTDKYDEFSPVCYKNGVVFCTNRPLTKILNYTTDQDKSFIKISIADSAGPGSLETIKVFSKALTTRLNDGPVTFSHNYDTVYFSRNLLVDRKLSEISSVRNKLGIFYAVNDGEDWTKIRELRFNSEWYNVTTPWLSPDGKKLFFASDKPDGYGGSDLYYCQWLNDYWSDPVNMGPVINTKGNEGYPFMNAAGEFFFSSDGHPGLGGKDIFFTRMNDTAWTEPICLDAPINSQYDDFGIYTDTLMTRGYFSSNRDKSVDVFHFVTNFPQVFYNTAQQENNYCYNFSDSGTIAIDSVNLQYKWSFGDDKEVIGYKVGHCFAGPGKYPVSLDIVERGTGRVFFTRLQEELTIKDLKQAYIDGPLFGVKGESISFNGQKSYLPGYKILSYLWDFGDRTKGQGEKVVHAFSKPGQYNVNLELALRSVSTEQVRRTGVSRIVRIVNSPGEIPDPATRNKSATDNYPVGKSQNCVIITKFSAEDESRKDAVYCVELFSSKTRINPNNPIIRNLPDIYKLSERSDTRTGEYIYTVDEYGYLMAAYPTFRKMVSLGYRDARVRMIVLTEPSERELYNLIRINGSNADSYFDFSGKLTSDAFIMLDQLVKYMDKFPSVKLEIAVHSDNSGSQDASKALTQKRAQVLVDYLINRGINAKRLVARGYGGLKPIAPNTAERDRRLNMRIDFTLIPQ